MISWRPRLFLIDGSAYMFRAFFAVPPQFNSTNLPSNGIYGFIGLILKFLKHKRPEYVAVACDGVRNTFRNETVRRVQSGSAGSSYPEPSYACLLSN